jgi:hypothetical protein
MRRIQEVEMRTRPSIAGALLCALTLLLTAASARAGDTEVERGIQLVNDGDYDGAIVMLDGAVSRLAGSPSRSEDLAQAYLYLGIAFVGKAHEEAAKRQFREALRLREGLRLSAAEFPPKIIELFEAARAEELERPATGRQAAETAEKKGGGRKWLFIGGGLAAAGGAAAFAAGGGESGPSTPPVLDPTVSIGSSISETALANVTEVDLTATARYLSGATFLWDLGDGESGSGQTVTHVFRGEGEFTVTVVASGVEGTARATRVVAARFGSGTWVEPNAGDGAGYFRLEVTQRNARLTGVFAWHNNANGVDYPDNVGGTLEHPKEFSLTPTTDTCSNTFVGRYNADMTQMVGENSRPDCGDGPVSHPLTLVRQ